MPNSAILWRGPSVLDRAPIVVVVTGLERPSMNTKTGNMLQTYILRDDVHPLDAVRGGGDKSVCGMCPLANHSGCYVNVAQAPSNLWKARAELPKVDMWRLPDKPVRIGAYGDPCAVPLHVWMHMLACRRKWTAFTHQWRAKSMDPFKCFAMASTEDTMSTREAQRKGWRTFRVRTRGAALLPGELSCPADTHGITCAQCQLCRGTRLGAKSISIELHGGAVQARRAANTIAWAELSHAGKLTP